MTADWKQKMKKKKGKMGASIHKTSLISLSFLMKVSLLLKWLANNYEKHDNKKERDVYVFTNSKFSLFCSQFDLHGNRSILKRSQFLNSLSFHALEHSFWSNAPCRRQNNSNTPFRRQESPTPPLEHKKLQHLVVHDNYF